MRHTGPHVATRWATFLLASDIAHDVVGKVAAVAAIVPAAIVAVVVIPAQPAHL